MMVTRNHPISFNQQLSNCSDEVTVVESSSSGRSLHDSWLRQLAWSLGTSAGAGLLVSCDRKLLSGPRNSRWTSLSAPRGPSAFGNARQLQLFSPVCAWTRCESPRCLDIVYLLPLNLNFTEFSPSCLSLNVLFYCKHASFFVEQRLLQSSFIEMFIFICSSKR